MKYTQTGRPLSVQTPLGPDAVLLERFVGSESLNALFDFTLHLLAPADRPVAFDKLLGQSVTVTLAPVGQTAGQAPRYFNGIVRRLVQGPRIRAADDQTVLIRYRAEVVPALWTLTRTVQSRIFQQLALPEILGQLLAGLSVTTQLQGTYPPIDYCVQYRESNFDFVSRLLEEFGVGYWFVHQQGQHTLVLDDTGTTHPTLAGTVRYRDEFAAGREDAGVWDWEKQQELRSGTVTLGDWHMELPTQNLLPSSSVGDAITVGTISHPVNLAGNPAWERYDAPADFSRLFDGYDPAGSPQPQAVQSVFAQGATLATIRLQAEMAAGLRVSGVGNVGGFSAGQQFTLANHPDGGDGAYFLSRVDHDARLDGAYTVSELRHTDGRPPVYRNRFEALPVALPWRPTVQTPRPRIEGVQSAIVVGVSGEDITCDPLGRVKVQFHWDRLGQNNVNSSCWVRVAQPWAGSGWGSVVLPRVGHEVVVTFEDGDPDRPLIVGSVYNAANLPPVPLPSAKYNSGMRSRSSGSTSVDDFSGLSMEDTADQEHVHLHSERHMTHSTEGHLVQNVAGGHFQSIGGGATRIVGGLPGVNIALGVAANDQVIGTTNASGSGSGMGTPLNSASGSSEQTSDQGGYNSPGPYYLYPSEFGGKVGKALTDMDAVIGWRRCDTFGLYTTSTIGQYLATTINPVALAALFGPDLVPATIGGSLGTILGASAGVGNAIFGTNTTLHYGMAINYHHGPKLEATQSQYGLSAGAVGGVAALAAATYASAAIVDMFLPILSSDSRVQLGLGIGMPIATDVLLGLWADAESGGVGGLVLPGLTAIGVAIATFPLEMVGLAALTGILACTNTYAGIAIRSAFSSGSGDATSGEIKTVDELYTISSPTITLMSAPPETEEEDPAGIFLTAIGPEQIDGIIGIMATQVVGIAGGDQAGISVETVEEVTGLITIDCGEVGSVILQTGPSMEPSSLVVSPEGVVTTSTVSVELVADESVVTVTPEEASISAAESAIVVTPEGITLTVGASVIEITAEGITISGPTVEVTGSSAVAVTAGAISIG